MVNKLQELSWRYLEKLYERSEQGLHSDVDSHKLQAELGFSHDEMRPIYDYLTNKGLISWDCAAPNVRITTTGIDTMQNSYEQQETRVLKAIYELSEQNTAKFVSFQELLPAVGMSDRDVTGICKGLEKDGYIEWPAEDLVTITRKGIHAIDSLGKPKERTGGDSYYTSIGTITGGAQVGAGNTQNIQINQTNNPEFDQAIAALLQIVNSSGLPNDEIEELRDEVNKLNRLALSEPKPDSFEKAKFRLDKAKLTFEGTKLLVQAAPYLHTIYEYFKAKYSLG